jgi:hypothetical protein
MLSGNDLQEGTQDPLCHAPDHQVAQDEPGHDQWLSPDRNGHLPTHAGPPQRGHRDPMASRHLRVEADRGAAGSAKT